MAAEEIEMEKASRPRMPRLTVTPTRSADAMDELASASSTALLAAHRQSQTCAFGGGAGPDGLLKLLGPPDDFSFC